VAVVGDHGELFGEHGLERHGNALFVQLLHVPFMIRRGDGGPAGTDTRPISIAALPSLVDPAFAAPPREDPVVAVLHPPDVTGLPTHWSAIDGQWHLIVRERGSESLYYLPADPAEARDLTPTNPADPAIGRLRAAIADMRREPKPDLRRFRSLGYLQ
jgi:hypothetical protein